ncbi:MAG: transglutaminase domain-containing protein, partial [Phycisphaerales bacterium JB058]
MLTCVTLTRLVLAGLMLSALTALSQPCTPLQINGVLGDATLTPAERKALVERAVFTSLSVFSGPSLIATDFAYPSQYLSTGPRRTWNSNEMLSNGLSWIVPPCANKITLTSSQNGSSWFVRGGARLTIVGEGLSFDGPAAICASNNPNIPFFTAEPPASGIQLHTIDPALLNRTIEVEIIGPLQEFPKALSVDLMESVNTDDVTGHVTSRYDTTSHPMMVIRRGKSFEISVTFDSQFNLKARGLFVELDPVRAGATSPRYYYLYNSSEFPGDPQDNILLNFGDNPQYAMMHLVSQVNNPDGTSTAVLRLYPLEDTGFGEYRLRVYAAGSGSLVNLSESSELLPADYVEPNKTIAIIFNPWLEENPAVPGLGPYEGLSHDPDSISRYVLSEDAPMLTGTTFPRVFPFQADQFADGVLDEVIEAIHLHSLSGAGSTYFPNVAKVLAGHANAADGGILHGNWGEPIPPSLANVRSPDYWTSSTKIIDEYRSQGQPVGIGQCFNFAGFSTGLLRSAGLAARPVWVLNAGIKNRNIGDFDLNVHYDSNNKRIFPPTEDSFWNFHVITEVYYEYGQGATGVGREIAGWHALDASRNDIYPAPFKGYGPTSIDYISTRDTWINDFDRYYMASNTDGTLNKISHDQNGNVASTTSDSAFIGSQLKLVDPLNGQRIDRTADYQYVPTPIVTPCDDLCVSVSLQNPSGFRDPNVMLVSVTNNTQDAQTVDCLYSCYSHLNGGFPLEDYFLGHVDAPVVIQPGQTHVFQKPFTPTISLDATQLSPFFTLYAEARAYDGQGAVTLRQSATDSFDAFADELSLLNPPQNPLLPGANHTLTYRVTNDLGVTMQDLLLNVSGYSGGMTINGEQSVEIPLQPLMPTQSVDVTVTVSSDEPDTALITAMLSSSTLAVR